MAKFIDSSIFIHAYLKATRPLNPDEDRVKRASVRILKRVEDGEAVITSTVHLSEVLNILESRLGLKTALEFLETFLSLRNLEILPVARQTYEAALVVSTRYLVSPNDSIAFVLCRERGASEIYSFDRHFDNLPSIARLLE